MAADFDVVGMKEIYFFALIGVEHRSIAVEVVDSELEIAGRFGSGTFFAEKQVVAAGLSQLGRCSISSPPTSPLVALKLLGNREGLEKKPLACLSDTDSRTVGATTTEGYLLRGQTNVWFLKRGSSLFSSCRGNSLDD